VLRIHKAAWNFGVLSEFVLNVLPGGSIGIVSNPSRCDTDWKRCSLEFGFAVKILQRYGNEWEAVSNPFGVPAVEREVVLLDERNELFLKLFCGLLDASKRKGGGDRAKPAGKDLVERVDDTKVSLSFLQVFEA